jgi:ABC-2 type transport system permease protein
MARLIATDHVAAIAQLRWRLFVNAFRGRSGKMSLVTRIILRIIVYSIAAAVSVGPIVGSGFAGYFVIADSQPLLLPTTLWILSAIWCFISLSASLQPALQSGSFDLSQLIRFPISFPFYFVTRVFFSFFSYTTIVGFCCLLATAVGIGIAQPKLFLWAAPVLLLYGFTIFFFLRMIFLWLDRWLSQRRTREIVAALFVSFSLAVQLLASSLRSHPPHTHSAIPTRFDLIARIITPLHPFVAVLPPNLASNAILRMHAAQPIPAITALLGVAAFCAIFLSLYALRLRGEFRGENFSETPARTAKSPTGKPTLGWNLSGLSPAIAACMEKETRYLLRGGNALVGLIRPLIFVAILTNRGGALSRSPDIVLPAALSYLLFGLFASLYNVFGVDGPGIHLYFLAPIRLRDVFIAKNLVSTALITTEVLLATLIVTYSHKIAPPVLAATLLWFVFALFTNLTVGNIRSLRAPRRVVIGKGMRQPNSRGGTYITLLVLFGSLSLCMTILWLSLRFGHPWLATLIFLSLAAAAFAAYVLVLNRIDHVALTQRDTLTQELCKS